MSTRRRLPSPEGPQFRARRAEPAPGGPAYGGLPAPESRSRRTLVQVSAVFAILVTIAYLGWRAVWTLPHATLWLAVPLLLLEVHALVSLALHAHDLWDVDASPLRPRARRLPTVAVLIPTYNEPYEILLPTVAAAVALAPEHDTWVLDDGRRPWVAEMARDLGARYHVRADNAHAKAGNVNSLLPMLDVDVIAVLDADHVASRDFLTRTLPYFADHDVALVQTPQDFYNEASFEHVDRAGGRTYAEQELFYRALSAGRNRWNAAFWCGTNALVRLSALREIGGVATETVTEDIHTTIRLHRAGWRSIYHNEVLARGLAAANAEQYLGQRERWGTGAMQVLRCDNPMFGRGLSAAQRLSYLSTLFGWFDSWRTFGYLLLPLLTVLSGGNPIAAPAVVFVPIFLFVLGVQRLALRMLSRGYAPAGLASLFEFVRLPANLRATAALFHPRGHRFTVTAKGRQTGGRARISPPRLLVALLVASVLSGIWYALTVAGLTPMTYVPGSLAHGAAVWLVVNGILLMAAIVRIRSLKYGAERRASVRFDYHGPVRVSGTEATLKDLSLTGMKVAWPRNGSRPRRGDFVPVELSLSGTALRLRAEVRSVAITEEGVSLGLAFVGTTAKDQAALALSLFRTGIRPSLAEVGRPEADDRPEPEALVA